jgi:hypothetical protein
MLNELKRIIHTEYELDQISIDDLVFIRIYFHFFFNHNCLTRLDIKEVTIGKGSNPRSNNPIPNTIEQKTVKTSTKL